MLKSRRTRTPPVLVGTCLCGAVEPITIDAYSLRIDVRSGCDVGDLRAL